MGASSENIQPFFNTRNGYQFIEPSPHIADSPEITEQLHTGSFITESQRQRYREMSLHTPIDMTSNASDTDSVEDSNLHGGEDLNQIHGDVSANQILARSAGLTDSTGAVLSSEQLHYLDDLRHQIDEYINNAPATHRFEEDADGPPNRNYVTSRTQIQLRRSDYLPDQALKSSDFSSAKTFLNSSYVLDKQKQGVHPLIVAVDSLNRFPKTIPIDQLFDDLLLELGLLKIYDETKVYEREALKDIGFEKTITLYGTERFAPGNVGQTSKLVKMPLDGLAQEKMGNLDPLYTETPRYVDLYNYLLAIDKGVDTKIGGENILTSVKPSEVNENIEADVGEVTLLDLVKASKSDKDIEAIADFLIAKIENVDDADFTYDSVQSVLRSDIDDPQVLTLHNMLFDQKV
ncbi:MAG: hypothetical protein HRT47_05555 [Candidatus Caenarcaniphilales bacterium]|nr:hypothetical protein [Candidatus Caenarcaniphilales bacterium]